MFPTDVLILPYTLVTIGYVELSVITIFIRFLIIRKSMKKSINYILPSVNFEINIIDSVGKHFHNFIMRFSSCVWNHTAAQNSAYQTHDTENDQATGQSDMIEESRKYEFTDKVQYPKETKFERNTHRSDLKLKKKIKILPIENCVNFFSSPFLEIFQC